MGSHHTIVVGGGVIGIVSAYMLARRGSRVTVLERDEVGRGASFGNAGCIAPGHLPINKPVPLARVLRWLADETSPLYIAPRLDPALARWLLEFRWLSNERHLRRTMEVLGPLGHRSLALYDEIMAEEEIACGFRRDGYYEIFRTEEGLAGGRKDAELVRAHGYTVEELDGTSLREREPQLAPDVVGALYHPEAATCDPYRFVAGLAEAARRRGAAVEEGVLVDVLVVRDGAVTGVRTADGEVREADAVLLATGAYSGELLRRLGAALPIQPAKGYHRDLPAGDPATPPLRIAGTLAESLIFCTPMEGFVRFAGTLEFSGVNHTIRRARLEQLTRGAKAYLPNLGDAKPLSEWCGLRPCLPDGLPAIGPVPGHPRLFVANGHAMMGLTLGPVTGEIVAAEVLDGTPATNQLRPERYARRSPYILRKPHVRAAS